MESNINTNNIDHNERNQEEVIGNCLDDFEILRMLGAGGFGCVYKVKSKKNNKIYALKQLVYKGDDNDEKQRKKNKNEIILLKYLNHENICKCFAEFQSDGNQYMLMEQYNNQDLYQYLCANQKMNPYMREEIILNIIYQCLEGLSYLHLQGIIHCDIKLGNLFMTEEGKIVIGDLGVSMVKDKNILQRITKNKEEQELLEYINDVRGSELFIAPEVENQGCDEKSDVYSLGVCFYALLYYTNPTPENMEINFQNSNYSEDLKNLIKRMIVWDRNERADLSEIKKEFNKFYFKRYIKNSGIHCITQCLLSFKNLRKSFSSNSRQSNSFDNNKKRIHVSLFLISIMLNTDIEKNNYELKKYFSAQLKLNMRENNDISPLKLVFYLINSLNNDLNEIGNKTEEGDSKIQRFLNRKVKLTDDTNIRFLYNEFNHSYKEHFKSVISDNFLGVLKVTWTCDICKTKYISFERFFSITFNINNAKEKKINIIDLFKKQNQQTFQFDLNKYVSCEVCKKFTKHSVNKKVYNLQNDLIIMFDRKKNKDSEIELKKEIIFNDSIVESFPKTNTNYNLIGIIYENDNRNENSDYIPVIKNKENWYEYKYGQIQRKINLDSISDSISKKIIALFYNKYNPLDNMLFEDDINIESEPTEQINNLQKINNNITNNFEDIKTKVVLKNKPNNFINFNKYNKMNRQNQIENNNINKQNNDQPVLIINTNQNIKNNQNNYNINNHCQKSNFNNMNNMNNNQTSYLNTNQANLYNNIQNNNINNINNIGMNNGMINNLVSNHNIYNYNNINNRMNNNIGNSMDSNKMRTNMDKEMNLNNNMGNSMDNNNMRNNMNSVMNRNNIMGNSMDNNNMRNNMNSVMNRNNNMGNSMDNNNMRNNMNNVMNRNNNMGNSMDNNNMRNNMNNVMNRNNNRGNSMDNNNMRNNINQNRNNNRYNSMDNTNINFNMNFSMNNNRYNSMDNNTNNIINNNMNNMNSMIINNCQGFNQMNNDFMNLNVNNGCINFNEHQNNNISNNNNFKLIQNPRMSFTPSNNYNLNNMNIVPLDGFNNMTMANYQGVNSNRNNSMNLNMSMNNNQNLVNQNNNFTNMNMNNFTTVNPNMNSINNNQININNQMNNINQIQNPNQNNFNMFGFNTTINTNNRMNFNGTNNMNNMIYTNPFNK